MAIIRLEDTYGVYYTSEEGTSAPLLREFMETNATYIWHYLKSKGWTMEAVAGLLGNAEVESSLNPGRWQNDDVGNTSLGYGLVQWTPATNYLNWVGSNPNYMPNNLRRFEYEMNNNLQWIPTLQYNFSFKDYIKLTISPEHLASAWLKNYERAGVEVELDRRARAKAWYEFLGDISPRPGIGRRSKFKWVLYARKLRGKINKLRYY